jgi:hypothetical protein
MSLSDCEPEKLSQACVESIQYASDLSTNGLISTIRAASNRGSRDTLMVLYPALRKYWNQEIGSAEADVLNSWPDQPVKKEVAPSNKPEPNATLNGNDSCRLFIQVLASYPFGSDYNPVDDHDTDRPLSYYQFLNLAPDGRFELIENSCGRNLSPEKLRSLFKMKRLPEKFEDVIN